MTAKQQSQMTEYLASLSDEHAGWVERVLRAPEPQPEEDPNNWLSQILEHHLRSFTQRLKRLTSFANEELRYQARLAKRTHVVFDPGRALRILTERNVRFVLVGMVAGYVRGVPYPSTNTDVTPSLDVGNLENLQEALTELDARPLQHDYWNEVAEPTQPGVCQLMTSAGMMTVVDTLPSVGEYPALKRAASLVDLGEGMVVWVASLDHIIRSKEAVSRPSDFYRNRDSLHVLMCKEALGAQAKYGIPPGCG